MHDPVDFHLAHLGGLPMPAALDGLEANVLAAIDRHARDRAAARTIGGWSVGLSLALGLIGGGVLGGGAVPAQAAPIGIDGRLAPSTLLLGR